MECLHVWIVLLNLSVVHRSTPRRRHDYVYADSSIAIACELLEIPRNQIASLLQTAADNNRIGWIRFSGSCVAEFHFETKVHWQGRTQRPLRTSQTRPFSGFPLALDPSFRFDLRLSLLG